MSKHDIMEPIAIVGMSGRFPRAASIDAFWRRLRAGEECITFFSDEELLAAGVDPALLSDPHFVPARGFLEDADLFDATFFGFSPREAEIMDPQHRLFLESAWAALEDAGYAPTGEPQRVGIYAGASMNTYVITGIVENPAAILAAGGYQAMVSNDKDFIATRAAYKLNLSGPAMAVQTACSTSLVAVHMACRALLSGECEMALAGGVSINSPRVAGYVHQPGMILSPDGHCRAFDAQAKGTVAGEGVGIVVLKRLADAVRDGDTIRAIIRGTAINNDGANKVGYTAPSVDGQAEVIVAAQAAGGVEPDTIGYIEAHGTGTELGDPIEIAALTEAFRRGTDRTGFCAIGSVKTNIGHLDAAAGVAGLIKAVLTLEHGEIAPSLHYTAPNPNIDFASSPFYVNASLADWNPPAGMPRRAGVSSFGIGGTNAHVVLEEAPPRETAPAARPVQVLTLSAKTEESLAKSAAALAAHLRAHPELELADVAYTLHVGRATMPHRRTIIASSADAAAEILERGSGPGSFAAHETRRERPVAFMFSGQGAQYVGMARELYETEPVFRAELDACAAVLLPHLGLDLRDVLFPAAGEEERAAERLATTAVTQPALFAVEYALARTLMSWGIRPAAMLGHSIGEYVAACIAGVFSRDDALKLVAARGRIMEVPGGAMLAVPLSESELRRRLPAALSIGAINGPALCAVSGPAEDIDAFANTLSADGVTTQRLHVAAAFHSAMMDPVLDTFAAEFAGVKLSPPTVPFVSNVTGTWAGDEVCDPAYWVRHLRGTVRFWDGVRTLAEEDVVLLEVGPGRTLASLAHAVPSNAPRTILTTLRHPREDRSDAALLHETVGRLWLAGVAIDWKAYHACERRCRVPLPTYAFDRKRHWIAKAEPLAPPSAAVATDPLEKRQDRDTWFYVPSWRRTAPPRGTHIDTQASWLLLADDLGVADAVARELRRRDANVTVVRAGSELRRVADDQFVIDPADRHCYGAVIADVLARGASLRVLHFWSLAEDAAAAQALDRTRSFYSILYLAQALADARTVDVRIGVVCNGLHEIAGEETFGAQRALALGPVMVAPAELPHLRMRLIDVELPADARRTQWLACALAAEPDVDAAAHTVAYRGGHRWEQTFEEVRVPAPERASSILRDGGTYVITGGLGGIGLTLARHLATTRRARLVLIGRSALPPRSEWETLLADEPQAPTAERIRAVLELEAAGGEVLVLSADVANAAAMREAFRSARQRFGRIHGVIHAAGVGGGGIVAMKTREETEPVLQPKVDGTDILLDLLSETPADFLFLCSSVSTVFATGGQTDYTAANAYLDAFARVHRDSATPVITANWDVWSDVGMAVSDAGFGILREHHARHLEHGILAEEGPDLFERALAAGLSEIIISTRDLPAIAARLRSYTGARTEETLASAGTDADAGSARQSDVSADGELPVWEVERTLAEIWKDLLGLEKVTADVDFFEAGGHSLLATQVMSRIHRRLGVDVPLRTLFEARTVGALAARIAELMESADLEREEIEL